MIAARLSWVGVAFVLALAAALLLIFFLPGTSRQPEGFAIRGPDGNQVNLLVYRFQPGKTPALVADEISQTDELAFAYENRTGKRRLLVFGMDEDKVPAYEDSYHGRAARGGLARAAGYRFVQRREAASR